MHPDSVLTRIKEAWFNISPINLNFFHICRNFSRMYDSWCFRSPMNNRAVHTSCVRKGLEEFFDLPENWGEQTVKSGTVRYQQCPIQFLLFTVTINCSLCFKTLNDSIIFSVQIFWLDKKPTRFWDNLPSSIDNNTLRY